MGLMFLRNCRVVDGLGNPAVEDGLVVVDGATGLLVYVGRDGRAGENGAVPHPAPDDQVWDLGGCTVLPGLFNCHTHLGLKLPFFPYKVDPYPAGYWSLLSYRRAVEAAFCGTTSLRCVGGPHGVDMDVRDAIEKKMLWGPRMVVSGGLLIAHGGHGHNDPGAVECSGRAQFMEAARKQLKAGADFIKICLTGGLGTPGEGFTDKQMTDDEVLGVVEVARMAGKKVTSHTGGDTAVQAAVRLGVDCIEHGYSIGRDSAKMMADRGAWFVPTLAVTHAFDYLTAHGSPAYQVEKAREAAKYHAKGVALAVEEGVKMAVGTDLLPSDPIDGTTATVREMELLVDAGMTPLRAIGAATWNSARLCGVDNIAGCLAPGKAADLVVARGEPDKSISDMRDIVLVTLGGSVVRSQIPGIPQQPLCCAPLGLVPEGGTFRIW